MARTGDMLFLEAPGILNRTAADEMERFDGGIKQIVHQIRLQINVMESNISGEYMLIEQRKWHGIIISMGSILLGMLLGMGGSVWLTRSRKKIINLSLIDSLTGIYNRRGLEQAFGRLNKYCLMNPPIGFSMLMMGIDKFKSINDRFGHDVGDMALKAFAENTRTMIRSKDVFDRFGGEKSFYWYCPKPPPRRLMCWRNESVKESPLHRLIC
ncbi:GGDEF domain-containing protein [Desulfosarcina variabilis]|uniref:GGDEF domain-containing protein n=1 Tax=Desulfosarcina variabilis TaxID=2300 RepID=UPI003AFAF5C6